MNPHGVLPQIIALSRQNMIRVLVTAVIFVLRHNATQTLPVILALALAVVYLARDGLATCPCATLRVRSYPQAQYMSKQRQLIVSNHRPTIYRMADSIVVQDESWRLWLFMKDVFCRCE
jgi:hypothetical protein